MTRESASQTAGPYLHIGLLPNASGLPMYDRDLGTAMVTDVTQGERLTLTGYVLDGDGAPAPDAMVELWQADAAGNMPSRDPAFTGWGRSGCDATGQFRFQTIRPGAQAGQAPHLTLWIVARGIGLGLHTRVYFDGEPLNDCDPILSGVPAARRDTLIARRNGPDWNMNVVLQGHDETVFLDI
ncbi:protocatechuate 3,4-dioxygenase, alpha subunit [Jannaschia faecimaris]|uniref:Protocatechuate 3,4-dioxygenase, alpha subunit n=1 Tax=Jannaschia faecimaris TaxID=1244108 RepID=A0A1H3THG8_9RHOB|nr:protocatechuate 3,4-dioxygenase subunit alpha [Jannaschia faecimaris]SDZ49694.1 protocatechuate 3,4-dioxygenase, alpha subunit [Jannaschia faecimaris]